MNTVHQNGWNFKFLSNGKVLVQIIKEGGEYESSYYYGGEGWEGRGINLKTLSLLPPNVTVLIQTADIQYSFRPRQGRPNLKM